MSFNVSNINKNLVSNARYVIIPGKHSKNHKSYNIKQLNEILKFHNLPVNGKKHDLVARIENIVFPRIENIVFQGAISDMLSTMPKNVLIQIALSLDLKDVSKICKLNKAINIKLFTDKDGIFWKTKAIKELELLNKKLLKPKELSWSKWYNLAKQGITLNSSGTYCHHANKTKTQFKIVDIKNDGNTLHLKYKDTEMTEIWTLRTETTKMTEYISKNDMGKLRAYLRFHIGPMTYSKICENWDPNNYLIFHG